MAVSQAWTTAAPAPAEKDNDGSENRRVLRSRFDNPAYEKADLVWNIKFVLTLAFIWFGVVVICFLVPSPAATYYRENRKLTKNVILACAAHWVIYALLAYITTLLILLMCGPLEEFFSWSNFCFMQMRFVIPTASWVMCSCIWCETEERVTNYLAFFFITLIALLFFPLVEWVGSAYGIENWRSQTEVLRILCAKENGGSIYLHEIEKAKFSRPVVKRRFCGPAEQRLTNLSQNCIKTINTIPHRYGFPE